MRKLSVPILISASLASAATYFTSVTLQATTPGSKETGNINVSGSIIGGKVLAGLNSSSAVITAFSNTASATGVQSTASNFAVRGQTNAASGLAYGGLFDTTSPNGYGVWALNKAATGNGIAGRFEAASPTGYSAHLLGQVYARDNVGIGTLSPTAKLHVAGSMKIDQANTLEFGAGFTKEVNAGKIGYGAFFSGSLDIVGAGTTATNRRITFFNEGGASFRGRATFSETLTVGTTLPNSAKIRGYSDVGDGVSGVTNNIVGIGVSGTSFQSTGFGMYCNGKMRVTGALQKGGGSFTIDHPLDPENTYLQHSFVESPDMMNIYNGNVTTDASGVAWVEMPDWFHEVNRDFRYQLTVLDESEDGFALAKIYRPMRERRFAIKTNSPRVKVSWQVTGIRKDPWAEANRIKVEEPKNFFERGTYLHPELYGQPESMGLGYKFDHRKTEPRSTPPPKG